jgi:DHA2 family multidrug resistance protein
VNDSASAIDRPAAGLLFLIRSLAYHLPVVDPRALKNRNFSLACTLSIVTGMGIFD